MDRVGGAMDSVGTPGGGASGRAGRIGRCRVHGRISVPDGARVRANVDAGTITAEDLNSPSFEASSGAGNLSASFLRPPSSVEMTTNTGILDLAVPPASYAVDAGAGV